MSEEEVSEALGTTGVPLSLEHFPNMATGETTIHCAKLSAVVPMVTDTSVKQAQQENVVLQKLFHFVQEDAHPSRKE